MDPRGRDAAAAQRTTRKQVQSRRAALFAPLGHSWRRWSEPNSPEVHAFLTVKNTAKLDHSTNHLKPSVPHFRGKMRTFVRCGRLRGGRRVRSWRARRAASPVSARAFWAPSVRSTTAPSCGAVIRRRRAFSEGRAHENDALVCQHALLRVDHVGPRAMPP